MSGQPVVIQGFPSSNRVPGAYGEVLTGQGGQSAANLPKTMLVVGLPSSAGTITPDKQVVSILSTADADNYAGPGSEGACMLYDALKVAGLAGVPLFYATATPANGATAATTKIRFFGTSTGEGNVGVRINGQTLNVTINIGDTPSTIATAVAQYVAGFQGGRLPVTATASTSYCVLTDRTNGQRGMQTVVFLDVSQLPPGVTASLYRSWAATTTYAIGDQVIPLAAPNGFYFQATAITTGTSGGSEPTWPTTIGTTVVDSGVTWTCWGSTATGNSPTTAVFLGNATGLENYTNLLATLFSASYDRIALAANDSVSVGAWKTQVDQLMGAPFNYLQHVVIGLNGTQAAAQSLAQTTLNDTSFEVCWELNCETHPSRIAAGVCALRALSETSNPNSSYDGMVVPTIAPQSQQADYPTLPVLISAINNSITPVSSWRKDGFSRIERAITTKSLTNGAPDYATIDVGMRVVPDFVLTDSKLYFTSVLQPANPVVQDNPLPTEKQPPSGVLTPDRCTSLFMAKVANYSKGVLSNSPVSGAATVPPICLPPRPGDVQSVFDGARIMMAMNVRVMPINHQIGISVRQQ